MKLTKEIIEKAKNLYQNSKSSNDIVNFIDKNYGIKVCDTTIRKWLKRSGVEIRDNKEAIKLSTRKHLPISEIIKLYTESKLPLRKLAKMFQSSKTTIHKILEENNIRVRTSEEVIISNRKYERTSFNSSDNEKAYLIGFTEGDITVFKKSKYTIGLITHSTHNSFTDLIKRCFSRYGNVKISPAKNKSFGGYMWRITAYLDNSFDFLLPSERKKFVEELSNNQYEKFLHFLAGLIDSDGSIIIRKVYNNFQFVIRIFGENVILLKGIKNKLVSLGFKPHLDTTFKLGHTRKYENIILRYNDNYSTLELSNRKDILRLIKDLPIRHSEKIPKKDLIIQITKNKFKNWSEIKDDIERIREKIAEDLRESLAHAEELYAKLHPDFNLQV